MRVATVRDFRDRASEMFRSKDVVLVTRDGRPAGFFLPWEHETLPDDVRREVFLELTGQVALQRERLGVSEDEVLSDFAAERSRL